MLIKPDAFENGKEIDFTQQYHDGKRNGRVSLRLKDNRYEVYVYWFNSNSDEVLFHSEKLVDCVNFSNKKFDLTDTTETKELVLVK
jgi:hypothetical protein